MSSVAKQILAKLAARLATINGAAPMLNNVDGRVFRRRPTYDTTREPLPAIFITRRGGGDSREVGRTAGPARTFTTIEVVYDVIGVVELAEHSGEAAEDLLADIERALEVASDPTIAAGDVGTKPNLLGTELALIGAQVDPPPDGSNVEVIAVGVRCVFPHKYGDPDHVEP